MDAPNTKNKNPKAGVVEGEAEAERVCVEARRWVRPVPARVERQVLVQRQVVVVEQLLFQAHVKKGKEKSENQTAGRVTAAKPGLVVQSRRRSCPPPAVWRKDTV